MSCAQLGAQCNPYFSKPLSDRPCHYTISAKLDDHSKQLKAVQTLKYINRSPSIISELRYYMYFNSFKNSESSFLKGAPNIFGQKFADRKSDEWGWIDIQEIQYLSKGKKDNLSQRQKYISLDDDNSLDQSVLQIDLERPLLPGDTAEIQMIWNAKIPKTIARAGYNQDFYLFCHWYPQIGVYELNNQGEWNWNCHQFQRTTEFYGDFGVYDVTIECDPKFTIATSGCLIEESKINESSIRRKYYAEDIIDFTWALNINCTLTKENWRNVEINYLLPTDYSPLLERYKFITKFALEYLDKHVGPYPHPSISVVCPPFHALRSGLMEYPRLITTGSFYGMPENIRTTESLLVHEFVHQYFMGILASNEKEEPWLDEGFATYFEDRIIDAAYGNKKSLVELFGFHLDNKELTRSEYTGLNNPREGIVARPAWEFTEHNRKGLIYSKTATTLHSIQRYLGEEKMDLLIRNYYNDWKFKHPRAQNLMNSFQNSLKTLVDSNLSKQLFQLLDQSIFQAKILDYSVKEVSNYYLSSNEGIFGNSEKDFNYQSESAEKKLVSTLVLERNGDWICPVEVLVKFEDGTEDHFIWDGIDGIREIIYENKSKIIFAQIDPQQKLLLDINLLNNSYELQSNHGYLSKYSSKIIFWIQNFIQAISILF